MFKKLAFALRLQVAVVVGQTVGSISSKTLAYDCANWQFCYVFQTGSCIMFVKW